MRHADINKMIKKLNVPASKELDNKIQSSLSNALPEQKMTTSAAMHILWSKIMRSTITKLAAAAVIIIAAVAGITLFEKTTTPVWAISQTMDALKNIQSATAVYECTQNNFTNSFKVSIKPNPDKQYSFNAYAASDEYICVIRDSIAYEYEIGSGEIYSYNINNDYCKSPSQKLWYEAMKNAPLIIPIAPNLIEALKLVASDWQEIYQKDDTTGKNCVFVTGTYKPLSASFMMVCDLETKLIVRAEYWENTNRQGRPSIKIDKIVYNTEIPDEIFDLEKTTDAKIINAEETNKRWFLFAQGCELDRNKQFAEAIKAYQQLYEEYPAFIKSSEALCLIGSLYWHMGQYDKAIEYFEKVPKEYSVPRYALLDAYRNAGECYMIIGQNDKALESFQNCLKLIDKWQNRTEDWSKYKEMVENSIEKIKSKNQ